MKRIIFSLIFSIIIMFSFTACNECKISYHTVDKIEDVEHIRSVLVLTGYQCDNDIYLHGNNIVANNEYMPSVSINDNDNYIIIHETYYQFNRFNSLVDSIKNEYPKATITGNDSDKLFTIDENNHIEIQKINKNKTISISYEWQK